MKADRSDPPLSRPFSLPVESFCHSETHPGGNMSSRNSRLAIAAIAAAVSLGLLIYVGDRIPAVHAEDQSTIYLSSFKKLESRFQGAAALAGPLSSDKIRALALASDDFDGDGMTDLAAGYATPGGGRVAIFRGNLDAFAPQSQQSFEAIGRGDFPPPFLADAKVLEAPTQPDFLATGMFIGHDGPALTAASRGGRTVYVLAPDASGNFQVQQTIDVPGAITALLSYRLYAGAYTQLVVGVHSGNESALLVYTGSNEGLSPATRFPLKGDASSFAFGNLDGDMKADTLILAGGQISILHGGSQTLEAIATPFTVTAAALGSFISD